MPNPPISVHRLRSEDYGMLAHAIGDTPESVISRHLLTRGLASAFVAGDSVRFAAAVIQSNADPGEPVGFGGSTAALWALLPTIHGWTCVNVASAVALPLGELITAQTGKTIRYYGDVYHTLARAVLAFHQETVHRLTPADLESVEAAPGEVRGGGWAGVGQLLEEGEVAGAIVEGRVVAIAFTAARTPKHADIGVATLEGWQNQGFATAAASIVARQVEEAGQTPVWSTGEDNWASLRVAQKLGFTEITRRTYVIPE